MADVSKIKLPNGTTYDIKDTIHYNMTVSRGEQLVTNGSAMLGNNTNFTNWTFDGAKANSSAGSFTRIGGYANIGTDDYFPVNANEKYKFEFDLVSQNNTGTMYGMLLFYDVDKKPITASESMFYSGTLTTLTQDLKAGDTVIHLADVSNYKTYGTSSHQRALTFWDYSNSFGYLYPPETYSRNHLWSAWTDDSSINTTNNTITLATAYTGTTKPAGTYVSQGNSGGTYKYSGIVGTKVPTSWTHYIGYFDGTDYSGLNQYNFFPPATAYCKVGFLWNYNSANDQFWLTNVSVKEVPKEAKYADTTDTSIYSYTTGDANGTFKLYPQANNELNFGGSAAKSTLFFGYRTVDGQAAPSKYVFSGSTGTASLQCNKVYLGSGTTAYIDGTSYTGKAANVTGTVAIANGGTGQTTAANAINALLNGLPTWTADPTDTTYFIRQDTGGSATYGKVAFSTVWNYISGKLPAWSKASTKPSYNFSEIGSTPTTLSGYGITDAKIASGVITLGSNTITPLTSSSTLNAAKLSGAIPSAVTATTQASTDNSTKIATTAYVTTAIANLPEPMVFKGSVGTGGTITSLPSAAASNEGHTYKVITALSSPSAKVGDIVISNGSSWVVIPSGDEPSGTVTSVAVSNGGGLSVSGSPVTSSGTITISHADTSSQASSSNSGRTYIQSLTLDTYGHVTGISTATETVTNTDNKLQVAEVTSGTLYYPIVGTGTAAATRQYDTTGFLYSSSAGTTNVIGSSTIILGNNTNSGVANNKQGVLCLYGTGTYGTCIVAGASTAARTLTLPDANGTVALTSDIPDVSGKIDTAGTGLSKSGTTLNHSNAVAAQSTQAIYPIKIDAQGHISAYGNAVTIPTVPSNIVNTITTTAGAHTAITSQKGNVSFNVPTTAAHVGAASSSHAHGNITNGGDITATAPTVASGDQIIINDHSASKITNGPTFDGSTTTKALTPKGTWETFASSDKQLEITELTDNDSGISYYPIVGRGNTSAIRQYDEAGFCYIPQEGTTANDGYATLILGNNITSGTAGNRQGELKLFDSTNYCGTLSTTSNHLTDIRHWYLPDKTGTIALVSDITAAISYPVTSVNSKTGAVSLTASDVGAVPTTRTVNSKALSSNISLTASDVGAVPTTRKVNNKALSSDITLSASDVSAVPTTRTVNSKALSANITLTSSDVNAVDKTNPLYDLDTSAASGDDADLYTALSNLGWNNSSYGIITS